MVSMVYVAACRVCRTKFKYESTQRSGKYCSWACYQRTRPVHQWTCKHCFRKFPAHRHGDRSPSYCSERCQNLAKRMGREVSCDECGKWHWRKPYSIKNRWKKFCSKKCHVRSQVTTQKGSRNHNWKGGISRKGGATLARAYMKGKRGEHKARVVIEADGYYVTRSGASKGLWDLVCYRRSGDGPPWRLIQVKNDIDARPAEIERLKAEVVPEGTRKELWRWYSRKRQPAITFL
jgi:hypothetical protein